MVGPIMSAKKAKDKHDFPSMGIRGNDITLRNTDGRTVKVDKNAPVYHRGNQNFGIYSTIRDAHRKSSGSDPLHIGRGDYRQTNDRKKRR